MAKLYKFKSEDSTVDEFGVDHKGFSLRDELEYNMKRSEEKENASGKRKFYQSLTGFAPDNTRWYENNPQRGNINLIKDKAPDDKTINDCLKSGRFVNLVERLKDREGRGYHYSDQPTNSGISRNFYDGINKKEYAGYPDDVRYLTEDQIDNLYCQEFYKKNRIEGINDDFTAEHVFDNAVNPGPAKGAVLVQKAINRTTGWNIDTNNGIGTQTLSAINNLSDDQLFNFNNNLVDGRKDYYNKNSPNAFKGGLINRANKFRK